MAGNGSLGYRPLSFTARASGRIRPVEGLNNQQILNAGLADWRKLSQPLHARYLVADLTEAADFVAAVANVVGAESQHVEMRLVHGVIDLALCTRDDGLWVTQTDIDLAKKITAIARASGLKADPSAVTQLEVGLDTAHEDRIGPFWSVLLTGSADNKVSDSVFDPTGRVPSHLVPGYGRSRHTPPALALRSAGSHPKWPMSGSPRPSCLAGLSSIRLEHHPSRSRGSRREPSLRCTAMAR